ncbi:PadR family transcriptional regulator [Paenibacillus sp. UNC451MF]|uniref:PadR family transcriptional regulator n=1 Tax=Paenibacillus sp. UNC451MF TaxID=1449063 RepID=UPI00049140C0|nr:PadR family transcriptional regulator [Paenibacillus sp. UNC451MF]
MRFYQGRHKERKCFSHEYVHHEKFLRHRHGGSRGGFGGRSEGKRRFFERGEFKFALLELLASEPMHGYQLIKAMEEKTGGLYTPSAGSIYPNLQLLDDMKLISYSETEGKKLYHITEMGLESLREREKTVTERTEDRWERHGRHRKLGGGNGKQDLRGFMKEWSDLVYLMMRASEAAQENPTSKQATQFQEVMAKFQNSLKEVLSSAPNSSMDETVTSETDSLTDEDKAGE